MALEVKEEPRRRFPMTPLIDLVFILNVFFLVTVTLSKSQDLVLVEKTIATPLAIGGTKSHVLIQLYSGAPRGLEYIVISPEELAHVEACQSILQLGGADPDNADSIYNLLRNRRIPIFSDVKALKERLRTIGRRYTETDGYKPTLNVAIRTEYDVPYHQVLSVIDLLDHKELREIGNYIYVLLSGGLANSASEKGLLSDIKFGERPPPPPEVPWLPTPASLR